MRKDFSFKIDKVKWDFGAVKKRSAEIMAAQYKTQINREVQKTLSRLEQLLINKIKNHPVSQEIDAGKSDPLDAPNLSGTLGGYGNLWSFIGFYAGSNPIKDIEDSIRGKSRASEPRVYKDVVRVIATLPKVEEVYENTPMPWVQGRSWAEGISQGISGFGRYLNTDYPESRSEGGVQSKDQVRAGAFKRTAYLAPIFAFAQKEFDRLISETFNITRSS